MKTLVAIAASILVVSCTREIVGPEHVKCTVYATGETFTAKKENASVDGDFLTIVDDAGHVWKFRMIENGSSNYAAVCQDAEAERKE